MTDEDIDNMYLGRAARMFARISGKPCVNIDAETRAVFVCRRIHNLRVEQGVVWGMCDWHDPAESRPDELTDELAIGCDLLDVGENWWFDIYFGWYLVFDPELVARSLDNQHSWVPEFLQKTVRSRTKPRPPPGVCDTSDRTGDAATEFFG